MARELAPPTVPTSDPDWIAIVRQHVDSLRYGVVQLVVHDGRVTQIEKTEKLRLARPESEAPNP
jgi:hypothetical protein